MGQFIPKISLHYFYSVLFDTSWNKKGISFQCRCSIRFATSIGSYACCTSPKHQTDDAPIKIVYHHTSINEFVRSLVVF